MAYLVDEFIDLRAHLQIRGRQAIPHTPGVIQRARAITVESQQRARVEDTHPLPEREVFGGVGEVSLAHTGQIDTVIETAAKELEGIAIEEANAAGAIGRVGSFERQPEKEAACVLEPSCQMATSTSKPTKRAR